MTNTAKFPYKIIRKPRLKHIYLRIKEQQITVTANKNLSQQYIDSFVKSKSNWIAKQLEVVNERYDLTRENAKIYLLGKPYPLHITIDENTKKETLVYRDGSFFYRLNSKPSHERLVLLRDKYYKDCSPDTITPMIDELSKIMNLLPNKITFRKARTRWGSCSSKNNISLNSRLMTMPLDLIRYVIIHELSHIKHKNHSKSFWNLVYKYEPNWKSKRSQIRFYEKLL